MKVTKLILFAIVAAVAFARDQYEVLGVSGSADTKAIRKAYRERLEEHVGAFRRRLENDGGRLVRCCSTDEPVTVVRSILEAVLEARR